MKAEFTAIIEAAPEGGYWAICPEVPGANGQGETIEETKNSLRQAIELILEDRRDGHTGIGTKEDELNIDDLKKLSKAPRLQAMESLWDTMLHGNGDMETLEWHENILAQRKKMIENGRASFISLSELKASRGQ